MIMELTKNFTLEELTESSTANRFKINNNPNKNEIDKLRVLCESILQPIRDKYKKPITVSSGYRCKELNTMIHGSKTSQHMKAEAADIHSVSDSKKDNKELFNLIVDMINNKEITVGQLINEQDYNWIHISMPYSKVNQILNL